MSTKIVTATEQNIQAAAAQLKNGALIGMPTETVYGVAANALDGKAIARIFEAKGRPSFNPLITHVTSLDEAQKYAEFSKEALELATHFWPGPLTLVLRKKKGCPVSDLVTAGLDTIAMRVPAHKTARALINAAGVAVAAPSANLSGRLSSTTPKHVAEDLGDKLSMILADGASEVGLESTVIDLSEDKPYLLRAGGLALEEIEPVIGAVELADQVKQGEAVKSPGLLQKHYAPSIPIRLNAVDLEEGEALLAFGSTKFMATKTGGLAKDLPVGFVQNLSESKDLTEAASNLFTMLHELDRPEHRGIAVMAVPKNGLGLAINDRLKRASLGR